MLWMISKIKARRFTSLFIAIAFFLATAIIMQTSGSCLKTDHAPCGIISFELAFIKGNASEIKNDWDANICFYGTTITSVAKRNTYQDFLFIPAYTFLLIVLIVISGTSQDQSAIPKPAVTFANLAAIAAGCDVVENFFMLIYLNNIRIPEITFGIFASVKFLIIVFIALFVLWSFGVKIFKLITGTNTKSA
jgi:hypothetical protein